MISRIILVENNEKKALEVTIKFNDLGNFKAVGDKKTEFDYKMTVPPGGSETKHYEAVSHKDLCYAKFSYFCTMLEAYSESKLASAIV